MFQFYILLCILCKQPRFSTDIDATFYFGFCCNCRIPSLCWLYELAKIWLNHHPLPVLTNKHAPSSPNSYFDSSRSDIVSINRMNIEWSCRTVRLLVTKDTKIYLRISCSYCSCQILVVAWERDYVNSSKYESILENFRGIRHREQSLIWIHHRSLLHHL
jgi:hypothetical protein